MNKMVAALVCAVGFGVLGTQLGAAPAQVIMIRHGEKPEEGNELNRKGFKRADALARVFTTDAALLQFGPPAAIYAMKPSGPSGSVRPIQTVTPLARHLGLEIHRNFLRDDDEGLVDDIMNEPSYSGKTVLISWEHKAIPLIAESFHCSMCPRDWDGRGVFDRAWVLSFQGERVVSFADLPERALPGDSRE